MPKQFSIAWNLGFSPALTGRCRVDFDDRSLEEIISDLPLPYEFKSRGVLRINEFEINRRNWGRMRLNADSQVPLAVTLHLAPRDPGTAIVAATSKTGLAATLTAAAINFVIGLALQLVVNALTGKPASGDDASLNKDKDRTSSLDANVLDINLPLPRVIGTHRVFPPAIVHPLVELIQEDEYVEAVFALAGPHKIDKVYAGDALLFDRVSGVSEVEGVSIAVLEGLPSDGAVGTVIRQSYTDDTRQELSSHTFVEDSYTELGSKSSSLETAYDVIWDGAKFIAVSSNGILTSADGKNWAFVATGLSSRPAQVHYDGVMYYVVGSSGPGALHVSADGSNWTQQTSMYKFLSYTTGGSSGGTYYQDANAVASASPGNVVVVGDKGAIAKSSNSGTTWTRVGGLASSTGPNLNAIAYGAGKYVAVGANGTVVTSTNGTTWVTQSSLSTIGWAAGADAYSIIWNGAKFVVGGEDGYVATSADGITWTNSPSLRGTAWGVTAEVNAITWSGTQFLAVGDTGRAATSPDGVTWTYQAGLKATTWGASNAYGVAWSGSTYTVVGADIVSPTSTDGVSWSYDITFVSASLPNWHTYSTREAPDEFWVQVNAPSGLYDGDDVTQYIRVPFRVQMRKRGDVAWQNLPEVHLQSRNAGQVKGTLKFIWGVMPAAPTPPSDFGWVYGAARTRSQASSPASAAWSTSPYWGDTGAYNYTTSTVAGSVANVSLKKDYAEFWLDPSVFPKGRYEFRIKRGYTINKANFVASGYTIGGAIRDPFWYYMSVTMRAAISEDQENRMSQVYTTRASSVWNEHPTPVTGDMAIIAIRAKNQQLPAIHCTASGMVYDWDGAGWNTFTTSSNPAPHYRYLLNNAHSTDPLPTAMIDDTSIVAWRAHCAAKGYSANMVIQDGSMKTALDKVAGCGYALPVQSEVWGVTWERDRSSEPVVQVFTPANSRNFSYKKGFARFTDGIRAQYRDGSDNYESREEIVFNAGANTTTPRLEQTDYVGLTTSAEVTLRATYDLKEKQSRNVFYTLEADADAIVCRRGDLVVVQSDVLTGQAVAGSLVSKVVAAGAVTSLTLDGAVELGAGPNAVVIRGLDGTIYSASISEVSVTTNLLTITSVLADSPEIDDGCVVSAGKSGVSYKRLIVTGIAPGENLSCTLSMADEAPELVALI